MIPSPGRIPDGDDAGEPSGGSPEQPTPTGSDKSDDPLNRELEQFHRELHPVVEQWIKKKPSTSALDKLVEISDNLFKMIYSQYRDEKSESAGSVTLKELAKKIRLAAFGLNDMREAGGNISPEDRLNLHDYLLDLDSALEVVLGESGNR